MIRHRLVLGRNDVHLWLSPDKGLSTEEFLRQTLSHYLPLPPAKIRFARTPNGKPYLKDQRFKHLQFNVSHSQGKIVCAVSHCARLGVDIENTQRKNDLDAIAQRYFHSEEIRALQATAAPEQRRHLFFTLWTAKEAYIKALGLTIGSASLDKVAFACQNDTLLPLHNSPSSSLRWHYQSLQYPTLPNPNFLVSVAIAHKAWQAVKPQISVIEID